MSDLPAKAPTHALRPADAILSEVKEALPQFFGSITRTWELAVLIDTDLLEIRERQLYKTAFGYTSFARFCKEELGFDPVTIRRRIARAAKTQAITAGEVPTTHAVDYVAPELGPTGRPGKTVLLPNPPQPSADQRRFGERQGIRKVDKRTTKYHSRFDQSATILARSAPPEVLAEPVPKREHPLVTWVVRALERINPEDVLSRGTPQQVEKIVEWVDRFIEVGQQATCEHHPDARSEDGLSCEACGKQMSE